MGTTPVGFVTGATDLGMTMVPDRVGGYDTTSMVMSGGDAISLGDIVSAPDAAFGIVQNNFMNNYQAMAVQSIGIGLSFRLGKRLLRRPISNVNRNIFKPLGAGFKL
jgi:hypothetical protein